MDGSTASGQREFSTSPWERFMASMKGSAPDIGWLQKAPDLPGVRDETQKFSEILERVMNGAQTLPDSLVYLLVPGLFSNLSPLYMVETEHQFQSLGVTCSIAKIHSQSSVEVNAIVLNALIHNMYTKYNKRVLIVGHSKGAIDAAAAFSLYEDQLRDKVAGLVFVQSPYGGTPVASDLLRDGGIWYQQFRAVLDMLMSRLFKGDLTCLLDLTYDRRRAFLADHPLPTYLPVVSFHTEASRSPSDLATLSHIAHTELPWWPITRSKSDTFDPPASPPSSEEPEVLDFEHTEQGSWVIVKGSKASNASNKTFAEASDSAGPSSTSEPSSSSEAEPAAFERADAPTADPAAFGVAAANGAGRGGAAADEGALAETAAQAEVGAMAEAVSATGVPLGTPQPVPRLSVGLPISGVLALLALHLEMRYSAKSDGMVTRADAEVPGSVVVRLERKLDHGFMVFTPLGQRKGGQGGGDKEATAAQICEALVALLLHCYPQVLEASRSQS